MSKKNGSKTANSKNKKTKKGNKKKFSFFRWAFKCCFVLGLWAAIGLTLVLAWYARELPAITKDANFERKSSIIVKTASGKELARYGELMGHTVTTKDVPQHLLHAIIATEDRRFYNHFGLDPLGVLRAMVVNVQKGGLVQGGSTITQQLAKNLFLTQERTLKRKIQEAMLAVWLEYKMDKDEILSAYLNRVYLGGGVYGVDAASKYYFKKDVADITVRQGAMLAALLKAPSRYSPKKNPTLANERANIVMRSMVRAGYITEQEIDDIKNQPPRPNRKPTGADSVRYYTDWVVDSLSDIIGTPDTDLIVYTTLNIKAQESAQAALLKPIMAHGEQKNMNQGAIVMMKMDGAVVGLVGGRDYGLSQFNRATQAKRSPGSSFKPFVYLTALEQGWTPYDQILDAPFKKGKYKPKNFANQYYGEVDLQTSLALSMNTSTVRLAKTVGIGNIINTSKELGITSDLEPDLSLSLGSSGVTLLEMATAYTTIANGGYKVLPYAITKIEDTDGTLYYQRTPSENKVHRKFAPGAINNLKRMMRGVIEFGTGRGAAVAFPAAGKTGTSQGNRDALFVGFSDNLVTAVWLGNDDNSPMKGVTGGAHPARIWREVMSKNNGAYRNQDRSMFVNDSFFALLGNLTRGQLGDEEFGPYQEERPQKKIWSFSNLDNKEKKNLSHEKTKRYND